MRNKYEIENDIVKIFLNSRKFRKTVFTYINADDFYKINIIDVCWYPEWHEDINGFRVVATQYLGTFSKKPKYKKLLLPAIILNYHKGIDHINHDTLDNRRCNLKIRIGNSNSINRKKANKNNKVGIRNVCIINGWYVLQLQINGKNKVIAKSKDIEEIRKLAEEGRKKYYS